MTDGPAEMFPHLPRVTTPQVVESAPHKPTGWLGMFTAGGSLILLVILAYWPLVHAGFIWDDTAWLVKNHAVHHWSGLPAIWWLISSSTQYYPLVYTAFLLQYKLWGLNTLDYHLVNIALQAVNAILLWRILKQLGLKSAWMVAAIFAIHPVQVETVGWVVEQKNLLSALFYFAAVSAWLRFTKLGRAPGDNPVAGLRPTAHHRIAMRCSVRTAWYLLATLFYILALLAKTDACTLPVVLWLLIWWQRGHVRWRDFIVMAPWLIFGAALAWVTIFMEHTMVGASGPAYQFSVAQRLLIAGKDLWFYPLKLLWPWPLLEVYPRWPVHALGGWQWLFPITACAVPILLLSLRGRIGRGPFIAVAFYGITIAPVLGFISFYTMIDTFVADHYQYLACIGLIALAAEGFWFVVSGFWPGKRRRDPEPATGNRKSVRAVVCGGAVLLLLAWRSNVQSRIYSPPIHIWTHVLKYNPDCPTALEEAGVYAATSGQVVQGMAWLMRAYHLTHGRQALTDANIGDLYRLYYHRYARAIHFYRLALRANPRHLYSIKRIVLCYEWLKEWPQAQADLQRGLRDFPRSGSLRRAFGDLLAFGPQPRYRAALAQYRLAQRYQPYDRLTGYRLAWLLRRLGRVKPARKLERQVGRLSVARWLQIAQTDARFGEVRRALAILHEAEREFPHSGLLHLKLADFLAARHRERAALAEYRRAVRDEPRNAAALYDLAVTLQTLGRWHAALTYYQRAVRISPRWARVRYAYGLCLFKHGPIAVAQRQFRRVMRLLPQVPEAYLGQAATMAALGNPAMQWQDLKEGLRRFPHSAALRLALADVLAKHRRYADAAAEYRRVVQAQPRNGQALYNLAWVLQQMGRQRAAARCYKRVVGMAPNWARAHFMYGRDLLAVGRAGPAAEQFRQALVLLPVSAADKRRLVYRALAEALQALGERSQAAKALAKSIELIHNAGLRRGPARRR